MFFPVESTGNFEIVRIVKLFQCDRTPKEINTFFIAVDVTVPLCPTGKGPFIYYVIHFGVSVIIKVNAHNLLKTKASCLVNLGKKKKMCSRFFSQVISKDEV